MGSIYVTIKRGDNMKLLGTVIFIVLLIVYFADLVMDVILLCKEMSGINIANVISGIIAIILLCFAYWFYLYL